MRSFRPIHTLRAQSKHIFKQKAKTVDYYMIQIAINPNIFFLSFQHSFERKFYTRNNTAMNSFHRDIDRKAINI